MLHAVAGLEGAEGADEPESGPHSQAPEVPSIADPPVDERGVGLPTMADLDGLSADLDAIDAILARMDATGVSP